MKNKKWKVKKLGDCIEKVVYPKKVLSKDFLDSGLFPVVSQEETFISGYSNDPDILFKIKKPVVIFGDHTRVLKYVDFDFVLGADGVKILQPINPIFPKYLFYYLKHTPIKSLGYARHYRLLKDILVYYPDLKEQQEIVKKLDKLSSETQKMEDFYKKKIEDLEELKKSLLKQAFEGKLV